MSSSPLYRYAFLGSVYNGESVSNFLECIESLKAQTVKVDYFLVVDGPIYKELEEAILQSQNLFTKIFWRPNNSGLAFALNYALQKIKKNYDYVIRYDTDDINHFTRTEKIIEHVEKLSPDICCSQIVEFSDSYRSLRNVEESDVNPIRRLAYKNIIFHPASVINVESFNSIGFYEHMPLFEDWLSWIKLAKNEAKFSWIDEPLVYFRVTEKMIERRYGFGYFIKEFRFFLKRRQCRFFPIHIDFLFLATRLLKLIAGKRIFTFVFKSRK